MRQAFFFFSTIFLFTLSLPVARAADGEELPQYRPTPGLAGELRSVGSDSMGSLMDAWVTAYKKAQPGVIVRIDNKGSASAPSALLDGTANLGPMARPMKGREVNVFRAKLGVEPVQVRTAIAAIGIYVPKDNPLNRISLPELDAIYSSTRTRGGDDVTKWADLGVTGKLGSMEIMPIGRSPDGYAHAYFRQQVLALGDFRPGLSNTTDTASTLETVAANPNAIGFGGIASTGDRVKLLSISRDKGEPAIAPTPEEIVSEKYPLSRSLSVYFVQLPEEPVDNVTRDFLSFVLSKEGQAIVIEEGLLPLPVRIVNEELAKRPKG